MPDVSVPDGDWARLRGAALFFVPDLVAQNSRTSVNRDLLRTEAKVWAEAQKDKALELSPAAMTNLFGARPMGHKKCESAIHCFNEISKKSKLGVTLDPNRIVGAVFCSLKLAAAMEGAKLSIEELAKTEGAGFDDAQIIEQMTKGKRVTFSVGVRIARLLVVRGVSLDLREFLTVRSDRGKVAIVTDEVDRSLLRDGDLIPADTVVPGWKDWREPLNLPLGVP